MKFRNCLHATAYVHWVGLTLLHNISLVQTFVASTHRRRFVLVPLLNLECLPSMPQQELRHKRDKQRCQEWGNWHRKLPTCSKTGTKTWQNSQEWERRRHRERPKKLTGVPRYFSGISRLSSFSCPGNDRRQTCSLCEQISKCRLSPQSVGTSPRRRLGRTVGGWVDRAIGR